MEMSACNFGLVLLFFIPQSGASENNAEIEHVLVTASKRSERLQEIPLSVTALTSDKLQDMRVNNLLDVTVRVPNLGMAYESDGRFDSSSPAIRGIFGRNTTGFYINDTPVNVSLLPRVVDLERVEVLRGPQGSLYGARSMGGTIRLITPTPNMDTKALNISVDSSLVEEGSSNHSIQTSTNVPISDTFALRASAYAGSVSGIQDRIYQETYLDQNNQVHNNPAARFTTAYDVDDETFSGGQLTGLWDVNENFSVTPRFMYQQVDADNLPFADITPNSTTQARFFDTDEPGSDEWWITSATLNWSLDWGEVVSTTAYYERETNEAEELHSFMHWLYDAEGLRIDPIESTIQTIENYESKTHETRFVSNESSLGQFTAGLFFQDLQYHHLYPGAVQSGVNDALNQAAGEDLNLVPNDLVFARDRLTTTQEVGVFGEWSYAMTDQWSMIVGGRFYDTQVDDREEGDGFANNGPSFTEGSLRESGFNPKLLLQFEPDSHTNIFTSAAKGMRVGGINGNLPISFCAVPLAELNIGNL